MSYGEMGHLGDFRGEVGEGGEKKRAFDRLATAF